MVTGYPEDGGATVNWPFDDAMPLIIKSDLPVLQMLAESVELLPGQVVGKARLDGT